MSSRSVLDATYAQLITDAARQLEEATDALGQVAITVMTQPEDCHPRAWPLWVRLTVLDRELVPADVLPHRGSPTGSYVDVMWSWMEHGIHLDHRMKLDEYLRNGGTIQQLDAGDRAHRITRGAHGRPAAAAEE
jgi:hypothetical protein